MTKTNNTNKITWGLPKEAEVTQLYDGVTLRILWQEENGAQAQIVEIEPGAKFEDLDVHEPGPEEVFVLEGVFNDGTRDFPEGTFIHNPRGSSHVPQSETGCKLFVFFPEG